jgi:hypothetical protein
MLITIKIAIKSHHPLNTEPQELHKEFLAKTLNGVKVLDVETYLKSFLASMRKIIVMKSVLNFHIVLAATQQYRRL